jgi:putative hemin transport protein
MHGSTQTIRDTVKTLRRSGKARHRDIAEQLRLSEGELIAAHVGAVTDDPNVILRATRLRADWPIIMASLEPLGEVMALTRNASCVHEKTGVYRNVSHQNHVGLVLGGEIDLRVFYQQWAHGFGVMEQTEQGVQRSLQFFDAEGTAIHKVFLKPRSNVEAYTGLLAKFSDSNQAEGIRTQTPVARITELPDTAIDVEGLHRAWDSLRDTHDFFGLLKSFGVTRTQALRLAEPKYVQKVEADDCQSLLQAAAADGVSIMVFVGNPGMIQIHSGPIKKVAAMGPWVNVLDPGFNLHLREDHIANAWVVKKPTVDGLVSSLELFDAQGDTIAMFFGERKPGKRELCEWRALIENIQQEPRQCVA